MVLFLIPALLMVRGQVMANTEAIKREPGVIVIAGAVEDPNLPTNTVLQASTELILREAGVPVLSDEANAAWCAEHPDESVPFFTVTVDVVHQEPATYALSVRCRLWIFAKFKGSYLEMDLFRDQALFVAGDERLHDAAAQAVDQMTKEMANFWLKAKGK